MTTSSSIAVRSNQGALADAPVGVREAMSIARDTLQLIGQARPDGTYVHDRETCTTLALDALVRIAHQLEPGAAAATLASMFDKDEDETARAVRTLSRPPSAEVKAVYDRLAGRPTGPLTVYTDGGCRPSNPGPAGWGIVVVDGDTVIEEAGGFIGHGTNQIAELEAAIQGLRRTPEGAAIELVSDSQYMLKGLGEWRRGWERRGWRNAAGEPVANKDRWQVLFALADKRTVRTRWVKGHNGDPFNERADRLATQAINSRQGS